MYPAILTSMGQVQHIEVSGTSLGKDEEHKSGAVPVSMGPGM